jgi:hypothetical protein
MAILSNTRMPGYLHQSGAAQSSREKGNAYEELLAYVIGKTPGVTITRRNILNNALSEEIDIAFFNEQKPNGFYFLPYFILAECKNWSRPLGSAEVNWFDTKLKNRGISFGILFAANGISGDTANRTAARDVISNSLREGRDIILLNDQDVIGMSDTKEFCELIKTKICDLKVSGTVF